MSLAKKTTCFSFGTVNVGTYLVVSIPIPSIKIVLSFLMTFRDINSSISCELRKKTPLEYLNA